METTKKTTQTQRSTYYVTMILAGISLITATLCAVWWLRDLPDTDITSISSTKPAPSQQSIPQVDIDIIPLQNEITEPSNEQMQVQLFNELWSKLHDPDLRATLTARELLDTPGINTLSTEKMQNLVNEAMALLDSNELDTNVFLAELSRKDKILPSMLNEGANEIPAQTTPEQEQAMESVRQRLRDPDTAETVTATQLLQSPEVQFLPTHLRHELANEVMDMLSRGELNSTTFLAKPPSFEPNTHSNEEAIGNAVTYEQWQAFEILQTRMRDIDFQIDTMLPELLTSQEYLTLPTDLRKQLSAQAVEMLEVAKSTD